MDSPLTLADNLEEEVVDVPPPEIFLEGDQLYHLVDVPVGDGTMRQAKRPVARTIEDARKLKHDYLDPKRGWFLYGYKWQRDQDPQAILDDASLTESPIIEQENTPNEP